jgi:site-specific recombinase XerD
MHRSRVLPSGRLLAPPGLHLHASGHHFAKFQGRFTYFGKDLAEARRRYAAWLRDVWSPQVAADADAAAAQAHVRSLGRAARARRPIATLVAIWLDQVQLDAGPARGHRVRAYYATHIARFTHALGALPLRHATAEVLEAIKADSTRAGYQPRTINHDLSAQKRFLTWAWDTHPGAATPFNLRSVRKVHTGELPAKAKPVAFIRRYIAALSAVRPELHHWLSLQYLADLRPSELPRLIAGDGQWHEPDLGRVVFAMRGKTSGRTRLPRLIALSDEALSHLRAIQASAPLQRWKTADGYGHAVGDLWVDPAPASVTADPARRAALAALRREFKASPGVHFLRHSAFDHLLKSGVPLAEARLLHGHAVPGAWPHYSPGAWHDWRTRYMSRLTLHPPPPPQPPPSPA